MPSCRQGCKRILTETLLERDVRNWALRKYSPLAFEDAEGCGQAGTRGLVCYWKVFRPLVNDEGLGGGGRGGGRL